jgi:hypothetical protein
MFQFYSYKIHPSHVYSGSHQIISGSLTPFLGWGLVYIYLFIYSFIHMCIHCLGNFSTLSPSPHQFQAGPVLPLSLILLKKRHKHKKEDKEFLLVKDSYTERFLTLLSCTHVLTTHVDSSLTDLYTGSWSPSHVILWRFKVLYQFLWSGDIKRFHVLGFLPIPILPICAFLLSCDPSPTTLLHLPLI